MLSAVNSRSSINRKGGRIQDHIWTGEFCYNQIESN
jgi:hypothetical protein